MTNRSDLVDVIACIMHEDLFFWANYRDDEQVNEWLP